MRTPDPNARQLVGQTIDCPHGRVCTTDANRDGDEEDRENDEWGLYDFDALAEGAEEIGN
jgi:hypothetical protein